MIDVLRVGTRRSLLARTQTAWVVARLGRTTPGARFEIVPLDASGDRDRSPGGSTDFTDRLDRALIRGELDLAVHSAKDLPLRLDPRLVLAACPRRADPRDCLVLRNGQRRTSLAPGARVGSSSLRRRAQLLRWRPDLTVVDVRGNVDTRIGLVRSGHLDAAVLAVAGVVRLGRPEEIGSILPTSAFLPAPAQGALAVLARARDPVAAAVARRIDHGRTRACVHAEREFASTLGGDCRLPLGALATERAGMVSLVGEVLSPDGRRSLRARLRGPTSGSGRIGRRLGRAMARAGAPGIMTDQAR